MPQRYLVTAATGGQGSAVARQLRESGQSVRCLVRNLDCPVAKKLQVLGCELVQGDFDNITALKESMCRLPRCLLEHPTWSTGGSIR